MNILIIVLYGLFCIVGGVIGFLKAGSAISLVMGVGTGALLLIAARLIRGGKRWPTLATGTIAVLLGLHFATAENFKMMPHLIMVVLSALVLIASIRLMIRIRIFS
jgi:uncharacterized membrane protein (UPF0136 family)